MNTSPKISVIMSVYNGQEYLLQAVESIRTQSFEDWELIIINDCSTDKTGEILEGCASSDARIRVYTNETNLRLPASLNKAISLARGKYIARMDADDICLAERLEKQYAFMEQNPDICLASCKFLTLKNGVLASGGCGGRGDSEAVKAMLLVTNPILHPGAIMRTDALKALKYDTSLTCTEDLELWVRMAAQRLKMAVMSEYLMVYRLHDKQITGTTLQRQHDEALKIEKAYYSELIEAMSDEQAEFYISGIYFREKIDVNKFCAFFKWAKAANRKSGAFDENALKYAFFEILAEYKRNGISKFELVKAMSGFGVSFLAKELGERKKRACADGEKCVEAAEGLGYTQCGGSPEFPVFSKNKA